MSNVFIIDDDKLVTQQLTSVIRFFGHKPFFTVYPQHAFKILETNEIDLILLDVYMPEINGVELLKQLKADVRFQHIPVIMLTGDTDEMLLAECFEAGAMDFINKPFKEVVLGARIQSALSIQEYINQLKKINLQMSRFVGIVSHDLRAPIGSLKSYVDLLGESPELYNEVLGRMKNTSSHALNLIQDLLDLTAMETGLIKVELTQCNFAELALRAVDEVQFLVDRKKVYLNNNAQTEHLVRADGMRILQVLTNLLTNAIKFTPAYGKIFFEAIPQTPGLHVVISDTGIGIDPEVMDKLFNKHEKVSSLGTAGERGTGYGLALSQEILHAHNSQITVRSQVGEGSTFSFILPWAEHK